MVGNLVQVAHIVLRQQQPVHIAITSTYQLIQERLTIMSINSALNEPGTSVLNPWYPLSRNPQCLEALICQ